MDVETFIEFDGTWYGLDDEKQPANADLLVYGENKIKLIIEDIENPTVQEIITRAIKSGEVHLYSPMQTTQ